jgi:LmbE family N-acetylglucosaminyl deacetylase
MRWIFLSPHLDDAVYSCGGLIWDLIDLGSEIEIWTVCSGDSPPGELSPFAKSLHRAWGLEGNPPQIRREEDRRACQILGALTRHLPYADCIYRLSVEGEGYYDSEGAIFGGMDPREESLVEELTGLLGSEISLDAQLAAPLGIGNHVDHEIVRKAVTRLDRPSLFYADYPYAREPGGMEILKFLAAASDWEGIDFSISEAGIQKWIEAALAYQSQRAVFWDSSQSLAAEIRDFSSLQEGFKLWKSLESA